MFLMLTRFMHETCFLETAESLQRLLCQKDCYIQLIVCIVKPYHATFVSKTYHNAHVASIVAH